MTATANTLRMASIRIPARLFDAMLIVAVGLAVLALRAAGVMAPDLTMPLLTL